MDWLKERIISLWRDSERDNEMRFFCDLALVIWTAYSSLEVSLWSSPHHRGDLDFPETAWELPGSRPKLHEMKKKGKTTLSSLYSSWLHNSCWHWRVSSTFVRTSFARAFFVSISAWERKEVRWRRKWKEEIVKGFFFLISSNLNQAVPSHLADALAGYSTIRHPQRMVRWCTSIWLTRLTLVCEVIRYRLVQVRQFSKKGF